MASVIKMLSKLKLYALAVLGALAAVFGFLWQMSRAGRIKDKLKGVAKARKVERDAHEALVDGLENESKEVENAKNTSDRSGFS